MEHERDTDSLIMSCKQWQLEKIISYLKDKWILLQQASQYNP